MADLSVDDLRIRHVIYSQFAEGAVPLATEVATVLSVGVREVRESYERLAAAHVVVLDPRSREVWMAMPFSAIPTDFRVEGRERRWYANCAWDAFGIAAALACDVVIATTCLDCAAPLTYKVEGLKLAGEASVVHFAVPAAHWWDDIGYT